MKKKSYHFTTQNNYQAVGGNKLFHLVHQSCVHVHVRLHGVHISYFFAFHQKLSRLTWRFKGGTTKLTQADY
jgi:hypothetical protein